MPDKLVVKHLYKIFGRRPGEAMELLRRGQGKDEIFAATGMTVGVQDASFAVREGEVFVVMGLSGSGKSTLVRMLNRLIEPTAGEVLIDGQDVVAMDKRSLIALRRREMAMVFQSFALMPHQSVVANAAFGLEVAGVERDKRTRRALEALDAVGLKAYANSFPHELSGGMKQRVGLARALANDPSIMLMDEAFSALDPLIRTEMQDELLRLQREHRRTVVFITHDLDEAMRIGDRIAVMQGGAIVQVGTPQEIVSHPANDYVSSFFKGVDVTRVFTAGHIAGDGQVPVIEAGGTAPRAALDALGGGAGHGIVVDADGRYRGLVSAESLADGGAGDDLEAALVDGAEAVPQDTGLGEVLHRVAHSERPLPVVDADGRYVGAITKTVLLRTLDKAG